MLDEDSHTPVRVASQWEGLITIGIEGSLCEVHMEHGAVRDGELLQADNVGRSVG